MLLLAGKVEQLSLTLETLRPREARRLQGELEDDWLGHRSVLVRWASAGALARAGVGAAALRARLAEERNTLVLTEICDALAALRDAPAIPLLRELCSTHGSPLVRHFAALALAEISSKECVPFLRGRFREERSRRMRARLACLLLYLGQEDYLPRLGHLLSGADVLLKRNVANLLRNWRPRRFRAQLNAILQRAMSDEEDRVARAELEQAIAALSPAERRS
jgi:HEAT repeat protein